MRGLDFPSSSWRPLPPGTRHCWREEPPRIALICFLRARRLPFDTEYTIGRGAPGIASWRSWGTADQFLGTPLLRPRYPHILRAIWPARVERLRRMDGCPRIPASTLAPDPPHGVWLEIAHKGPPDVLPPSRSSRWPRI